MNDRELLEMAAKAAGLDLQWCDAWKCMAKWISVIDGFDRDTCWNPLKDDAKALRLAVILSLNIFHTGGCAYALESDCNDSNEQQVSYCDAGDMFAATRRAIVRAAAEIGKDMP